MSQIATFCSKCRNFQLFHPRSFDTRAPVVEGILREKFEARRKLNPRYSLRAFAKFLGVHPGTLGHVLSGERKLPLEISLRVAKRLSLKPRDILESFDGEGDASNPAYRTLTEKEFSALAAWHHYAIVAALTVRQMGAIALADSLSLSQAQCSSALNRLERLGIIQMTERGYRVKDGNLTFKSPAIPQAGIRKQHRVYIHKALKSIQEVGIALRDLQGITFAFPTAEMTEARAMIEDFCKRFAARFETSAPDAVYRLNLQFFPVSKNLKQTGVKS